MKIIDRIILTIYTFCMALASILLILLPFNAIEFLSVPSISNYIRTTKGNYWISVVGLAFLLVSIRFLVSGIRKTDNNKYIVRYTNLGELKISTQTIEGLAQNATLNVDGIKDIKTMVILSDDKITVGIKGTVNPEINIPETTNGIQQKVKEHIERCTGIDVGEVRVEISNISAPTKVSK